MKRTYLIASGASLLIGAAAVLVWIPGRNRSLPAVVEQATRESVEEFPAAATAHRKSPVPAIVRKLEDPSLHLDERIEAIRALPTDLSQAEIAALLEIMRQGPSGSVSPTKWYVVVNELMEVMRQPRYQWRGFGIAMEDLMKDRHLDPVVRDYAAQHLAHWLGDTRNPSPTNEVWNRAMESYLVILNGEREAFEPVMGTSLMALSDLHDKMGPGALAPTRNALAPILADYITGKRPASLANRISSIQASGRMSIAEVLPHVRKLAGDAGANPSVRLSSVAALGYFRDPMDRPFLEELAVSGDRLRFAAREALKKHQQ